MNRIITLILVFTAKLVFSQAVIIDHNCTKPDSVPVSAIEKAKQVLHIAYGHTSHGSQLITGMDNLDEFKGGTGLYLWNDGPASDALDIDDRFVSGDLGHNGDTTWASRTRAYLNAANHSDVNVVIWSWCGGMSDNTEEGVQTYLDKMNELEKDYPDITFVYMTGHSDIWSDETLKRNNRQVRDYCKANNKVLYDFYDIERYNPDGKFFEFTNDDCSYYSAGDGSYREGNWAEEWQNSHTEGVDWYQCGAAHTKPLNANLKAYAAWWLWARIAGWKGTASEAVLLENNKKMIQVYPNPVSDILYLDVDKSIYGEKLKIADVSGKTVMFIDILPVKKQQVNVSMLVDGIYFLKGESGASVKFVKHM